MTNTVKIKRSSVSGKAPTTSQLELGELAVNTYDGKLYTKKDDGTASIVEIGGGGVSDGDKGDVVVSNGGTTWTVEDDSHNHIISNVDGLQTALDAKLPKSGGQMTGNITFAGSQTVDGRDLSVDGAKLDGIAAGAEVNVDTNLGVSTSTTSVTITSSTGSNTTIGEATGTAAGVMSTAHHNKLDGIESGATADQTAAEILAAVKTVDGGGSGLDADTVDGIQASSFVRSDANDTVSGQLTFNANILMGGTGAIKVANGTTAQRPSASNGMVRYNTTLGCLEAYVQSAWQVIANTSLDYGLITAGTATTFDYGAI